MKRSRRKHRVPVKACSKCNVLLSMEYPHDLCPGHFKEEYGYEPEDR